MNLSTEPLSTQVSDIRDVPMLFTADGSEAADRVLAAAETAIMGVGETIGTIAIAIATVIFIFVSFYIAIFGDPK